MASKKSIMVEPKRLKKKRISPKAEWKCILQSEFESKMAPTFSIIDGIYKRSTNNVKTSLLPPSRKFDDLYCLLHRKELFIQAYGNLKNNKGSLTAGPDNITMDGISLARIENLVEAIKNGRYKFKAYRRIYIPKPGKKKKRPLGIPNFTDRLVQEAIRIILEAIYEPIFERQNVNFGFRRKKSAHHAMYRIKKLGSACELALEGDIVGAYDNVSHRKLMGFLAKQISDPKFLKLISQGLKCGMLEFGKSKDRIIGTPQGGIASAILFNIYMHEFDVYVTEQLTAYVEQQKVLLSKVPKPIDKSYANIAKRLARARSSYRKYKGRNKDIDQTPGVKNQLKITLNEMKSLVKERLKRPSIDTSRRSKRLVYTRYADDWLLLTNGNSAFALEMKMKITQWLKDELEYCLDQDKTLITNLKKEKAFFLGFSIYTDRFRRISTGKLGDLIRSAGWELRFGININKVLERLQIGGFCKKEKGYRPIAKSSFTVLNLQDIVVRYNSMIRGSANYFFPVTDIKKDIVRIFNILQYSCYGTIAKKLSSKISKIRERFGKPFKFTLEEVSTYNHKKEKVVLRASKSYQLLSYNEVKRFIWKRRLKFRLGKIRDDVQSFIV